MPSTSRDYIPFSNLHILFVRPLSKRGPRKQQTWGNKRSCCFEKDAPTLEQCEPKTKTSRKIENSKKKAVKKAIFSFSDSDEENHSVKKINKKVNIRNKNKIEKKHTEEEDYFCLVCAESYSDSLTGVPTVH